MERRPTCIAFSIITVFSLVVVAVGAFMVLYQNPRQAERTFGPPSPSLNSIQRIYYANRLKSNLEELTQPHNPFQEPVPFLIRVGDTPYEITNRLLQLGLIPDAAALRDYISYTGIDTALQAGEYLLSAGTTPVEIAQTLHSPASSEVMFKILPGWRLEEIAESLPTSGLSINPEEFLDAVRDPSPRMLINDYLPSGASLEGLIPPGEYQLPRQTNVNELITFLTNSFIAQINEQMLNDIQNQGLNLYQAVTLASIIQREAVLDEEMPLIASVFFNRLAEGMKLESDPTVQYAIGFDLQDSTWWKNPLTLDDLKFESPYNTYLYANLPPGPISAPSMDAMGAVASPADTPYYFFRATCDNTGRHLFARTFEEHLQNACTE